MLNFDDTAYGSRLGGRDDDAAYPLFLNPAEIPLMVI